MIPMNSLVPALSKDATDAQLNGTSKLPRHDAHRLRKDMRARLVAQEYVRNGMHFANAWKTVTGYKSVSSGSVVKVLGASANAFFEELSRIVQKSDIDRDQALQILWAMVNASVIDFLDDRGNVLTVGELRKLPRVLQVILSEIKVHTKSVPVKDDNGKIMVDDNGSPYLRTEQRVELKIPEKMAAIQQLAQLMKWVGPANQTNIQINIGRLMSDADARRQQIETVYAKAKVLDQDD